MSIFNLSEGSANTLYSISNLTVLIATIAGVAGAIGLFWAGGVKEKYAEIREANTQQKIAEANTIAALANEGQAKANQRVEELRKENLELQVALLPRKFVDQLGAAKNLAGLGPIKYAIEYDEGQSETARQIEFVLHEARWIRSPVERVLNNRHLFSPGVGVFFNHHSENEHELKAAADALISELNKTQMHATRASFSSRNPTNVLFVLVGRNLTPSEMKIRQIQTQLADPALPQDRRAELNKELLKLTGATNDVNIISSTFILK